MTAEAHACRLIGRLHRQDANHPSPAGMIGVLSVTTTVQTTRIRKARHACRVTGVRDLPERESPESATRRIRRPFLRSALIAGPPRQTHTTQSLP